MIRFIFFFLKLFLVLGVALLVAYTPGEAVFEWYGYRVHTTLGVFLGGIFLLSGLFAFLYLFGQYFWRLPKQILRAYEFRKFKKGYRLLLAIQEEKENAKDSTSLVQSQKLQSLFPSPVLGMSLEAEIYEKQGELDKARRLYSKISSYKGGEYLGLFNLARLDFKQKDYTLAKQEAVDALKYKEQASFPLFLLAYVALEQGNLQEAVTSMEKIKPLTSSQKQLKNHLKAYIWYKRSEQPNISAEEKLELLSYAQDFYPGFVPVSLSYAKLLVQEGKISKASKILENNWKETQDRSVGYLYVSLGVVADPLESFRRAKYLRELTPSSVMAAFLVAETAFQAKLWGEARAALETVSIDKRGAYYYVLQSQIVEKEGGEDTSQILSILQANLKSLPVSECKCKNCSQEQTLVAPFCVRCFERGFLECKC